MILSSHPRVLRIAVACAAAVAMGVCPATGWAQGLDAARISFSRDIRPILSDHCFECHGPDEKKRQAELRLDLEADAKRDIDGRHPVFPGDPARSELWRRIASDDDDQRMPPPDSGRRLSSQQIELLRRWIEQGAAWEQHWSFARPQAREFPQPRDRIWARNPVDLFIAAKLDQAGLRPNSEAGKERLVRRVTLDLTGAPPTPEEIDAFLADDSPQAYERLVERLLASPRYGERMAWIWLDAARYADTSGYQNDGPRSMWRWRDWVIDALNANMPFDQFTTEQIAGDLLPNATREQRIATGFNRNHRGNSEGGIIPEEYQVEYVVDRVDTTCTVWLGLTMGCARCHDHKYDPLKQTEFYGVFAYFNNIPEFGRAIKEGNSPPYLTAPTTEQERRLAVLDRRLADAEQQWASLQPTLARLQNAWEETAQPAPSRYRFVPRGLAASFDFEEDLVTVAAQPPSGPDATAPNLTPRWVDGEPCFQQGRVGHAIKLDGRRFVDAGDAGNFGYFDKFSVAFCVQPKTIQAGTIISRMVDEEQAEGWYVQLRDGHLQVNLVKRWLDDAIRIETVDTIAADTWTHVALTYDGSRLAKGIRVYFDGRQIAAETRLDLLNQTFATKEPLRIGGGGGPQGRMAGAVDDVRLYQRSLEADEVSILASADSITEIVRLPSEMRSPAQRLKLASYYLETAVPSDMRASHEQLVALRDERHAMLESLPSVMVMEEMPRPRETFVLRRGEYDKHGHKVTRGVPACLPPLPERAPNNRLGFARWLVSRDNPLTARVAVNRIWQMHFGAGLVRTPEDFGVQGDPPTHFDLLDWLAVEFMNHNWDLKHLHRLIVNSATYRQSAAANPEQLAKDPDNRWLGRGPRFRISSDMIRDQALAVSGLLVEQLGGPSVKPYQPADLWKDLATDNAYVQDHGANLYRRSLYTYWKRTVAPPSMIVFDAAGREACQVRSTRTNTPLQALTLLNEVTYVEAARVLAQRIMTETGASPEQRLTLAFRLCASRRPSAAELRVMVDAFQDHLARFRGNRTSAEQLLSLGEYPRDRSQNASELAAYTAVANLILNLDEVVTRQ